jgi:hypothetical protein
MKLARGLASVFLAALLGACGESTSAPGTPAVPALNGAPAPDAAEQLLQRIHEAPSTVAYHGTRRVKMSYHVVGVPCDLEYVERVFADGQGRFGIEVLDVVSPSLSADDEDFFKLLQGNRQGFFYRSRDFRIRDLDLFREGYTLEQVGYATACGRECVELEVRRRERSDRWYTVAVDPRTGLVLRSEEHVGGQVITSIAFEELQLGLPPDAAFYKPPFELSPFDAQRPGRPQVGFEILRPSLLPDGYRVETIDKLEDQGRTWVRWIYGDGVEQVFFLHSPEPAAEAAEGSPGALEARADPLGDRVTVAAVGPWTVVDGAVRGQAVVAMGKVSEASLLQLVQSALESPRN